LPLTAHFINRFLRRLAEGLVAVSVSARTPPQADFLMAFVMVALASYDELMLHLAFSFPEASRHALFCAKRKHLAPVD
jgi:hypothetical protein